MPTLKQSNGDGTFSDVTSSFPVSIPIGGSDSYDAHINIQSSYSPGYEDGWTGEFVSGDYNSLLALIDDGKFAKILVTLAGYYGTTLVKTKFVTDAVAWYDPNNPQIGFNTVFRYAYFPAVLHVVITSGNDISVQVKPL